MQKNKRTSRTPLVRDFVQTPDGVTIVNPTEDKKLELKMQKAEDLLKNIYQWLLSNDDLEEEDVEQYSIRIIREINHVKLDINKFFKNNV
tara:strand:+ start:146 stop:415 length:270 start_codon:yes stop_codon:yes gene_type:complete